MTLLTENCYNLWNDDVKELGTQLQVTRYSVLNEPNS